MNRRDLLAATAATILIAPARSAFAADASGRPTAAEKPFVTAVSADLTARFATIDAARKAGFFRYTDEDDTGAISYANLKWTSADQKHPSQLWYDVEGRLIGCDFSVPYTEAPPELFGLQASRWQKFGAHAHYGLVGPGGTTIYGYVTDKTLAKTGGSVEHPTPAMLVAAGVVKKASDVRFVFTFPAIWDVSMWVIPNSDGAFADKNPAVRPANAKAMPM